MTDGGIDGGTGDPWQAYLDEQERALAPAVAALVCGEVPAWPQSTPPAVAPTAAARERARAIQAAVAAVHAAAETRQRELAVELAALAHPRTRTAAADDPTLGASLDLST